MKIPSRLLASLTLISLACQPSLAATAAQTDIQSDRTDIVQDTKDLHHDDARLDHERLRVDALKAQISRALDRIEDGESIAQAEKDAVLIVRDQQAIKRLTGQEKKVMADIRNDRQDLGKDKLELALDRMQSDIDKDRAKLVSEEADLKQDRSSLAKDVKKAWRIESRMKAALERILAGESVANAEKDAARVENDRDAIAKIVGQEKLLRADIRHDRREIHNTRQDLSTDRIGKDVLSDKKEIQHTKSDLTADRQDLAKETKSIKAVESERAVDRGEFAEAKQDRDNGQVTDEKKDIAQDRAGLKELRQEREKTLAELRRDESELKSEVADVRRDRLKRKSHSAPKPASASKASSPSK